MLSFFIKKPFCLQIIQIRNLRELFNLWTAKEKKNQNMKRRLCVLSFCCLIVFFLFTFVKIKNQSILKTARSQVTSVLCNLTQSQPFVDGSTAWVEKSIIDASNHQQNMSIGSLRKIPTPGDDVNSTLHVTVEFSGRLGNHLFIYATLLGVARAQNRRPFIRDGIDLGTAFQISFINPNISNQGWAVVYEYKHTKFESKFMDLPQNNLTLIGSFQSWKYFHHIQDEIRREFLFIPSIQKEVQSILESHRAKLKNHALVGVHVRRGDFLTPDNVKLGFGVPNAIYFVNAFSKMRSVLGKLNVTFLVASDDLQWCRSNLNDSGVRYLPDGSPAFHLAALAGCDHVIISGGTFGWWSAWLANGITIYYKKYVMENTRLNEGFDKDDYYLPGWIGLDM
ncbi:Galactoside 2-alpha-L-fucosyltransferase 1 [Bulinus truncatus]|nr:Galactoside 2-alpha-L-fucosyltransferase 1 [Bulinus truncatus]